MKSLLLFSLLLNLTFFGCGPSQQEIEAKKKAEQDSIATAQKNLIDSVAQATATATKNQIEDQRAMEEAATLQAKRNKEHSDSLYERMIQCRSELEAANLKLNDAKNFKFGRTSDEKYAQVQKAKSDVDHLRLEISRIENELRGKESVSSEERVATEKAVQDSIAAAQQAKRAMQ
jgi:hypothetical protein